MVFSTGTNMSVGLVASAPTIDCDGWLDGAERVPSPNCDQRPAGDEVSLLVIHNISLPPGEFGSGCVERFFCNQLDHTAHPFFKEISGLQVSSHFFIDRTGRLVQLVSTEARAWHAGVSCFDARERCNDYSIGVELEGTDNQSYTDEQYVTLASLTDALIRRYPAITAQRIAGHSDIAPGRKTDPGAAFDWSRYRHSIFSFNKDKTVNRS